MSDGPSDCARWEAQKKAERKAAGIDEKQYQEECARIEYQEHVVRIQAERRAAEAEKALVQIGKLAVEWYKTQSLDCHDPKQAWVMANAEIKLFQAVKEFLEVNNVD